MLPSNQHRFSLNDLSHVGPSPEDGAIDALLDDARSAVDPFLAVTLYERALHARPDDTSIMGEAAELMLQVGDTATAQEVHTQQTNTTCKYWF